MKYLKKIGISAGYLIAIFTVLGGAWAFADHFEFRFAYKQEVTEISKKVEVVSTSVLWLELIHYERLIKRGIILPPKECAKYRRIARILGVTPQPC